VKHAKTAVIVADSYGSPFEELKIRIQPEIWSHISDIDVYYMLGTRPNARSKILNKTSESLRYTKLWPLQRTYDNVVLNSRFRKIPKVLITGNQINVDVNEGLRQLGRKSLAAYHYLYESGYENIYKTTLSSIINPTPFAKIIDLIDSDKPQYTGTVINFGKYPFVSGANLLMNRKAVKILLNKKSHWQHGLLDDVAIGRLLYNCLIDLGLKTINIQKVEEIDDLSHADISSNIHFRCKSSNTPRNDLEIMRRMIGKIYK
jgi:hypothetical protein